MPLHSKKDKSDRSDFLEAKRLARSGNLARILFFAWKAKSPQRIKRPARAITGVQLDGGRKDRSGVPHHGTHTRKCALNFEIIGTLARPQPSATIRIRNRQPTRSSHCYLYITSIELGYFSDHRRLRPQSRAGFAFAIAWWTRENISFLDRSSTSALDSGIYIYRFLSSFESRHLHSNRPAQVERRCHAGKFTHL